MSVVNTKLVKQLLAFQKCVKGSLGLEVHSQSILATIITLVEVVVVVVVVVEDEEDR